MASFDPYALLMETLRPLVDLVRVHAGHAGPAVFALALLESVAVVSLFVPATLVLIAIGALVVEGSVALAQVWIGGTLGVLLGDAICYTLGHRLKDRARSLWPFRTRPELMERGHAFFRRWGGAGIWVGRFVGPLRGVVPLSAGALGMSPGRFWGAAIPSAVVWVPAIMLPGAGAAWLVERAQGMGRNELATIAIAVLVGAVAVVWLRDWIADRYR